MGVGGVALRGARVVQVGRRQLDSGPLVGADATEEQFVMLKEIATGYGKTWCLVRVVLERDGAVLPF